MRDNCKQLEPMLHDYAEGWLAESQKTTLLSHLQRCTACQEKLKAWSAVGRALRELPRMPAPKPALLASTVPEPRFALRLALALCLPAAMLINAYGSYFKPPALEQIAPYAPLHALTELAQEWLILFWSWVRGIL